MKNSWKALVIIFSILVCLPKGVFAAESGISDLEKKIGETTDQVSSTLIKAKQLINVATTSAGVAVDVYNKGEKAVSSTVEVVRRGSAVYENLRSVMNKIGDLWNWITNNNEFWRVAVVVTFIIIFWIIIRFTI